MRLPDLSFLVPPLVATESLPAENVLGLYDPASPPEWAGRPRVALLMHGVACTWKFMRSLARELKRLEGPRGPIYGRVILIAYDWRRSVDDNAIALIALLERLAPQARRFDLYGYSMGGLVGRRAAELLPDEVDGPRIGHLFTFNSPHRGSPLAGLVHMRAMRFSARLFRSLSHWVCDGIRDIVPGSEVLQRFRRSIPTAAKQIYLAGDSGSRLLGGVTQVLFSREANDGVATVASQLDLGEGGTEEAPHATRLVYPWDHFSLLHGLRQEMQIPLETITRILLAR
jgi:pimeloyl-ACP methyl ester carboxylesterase